MYKHHPSLVLGFHVCEREIGEGLINGTKGFWPSKNSIDWLGHGMYFWENSPHRAEAYGNELVKRGKLQNPMVIGAVIHLGYCFDLLESYSLTLLQKHYSSLKTTYEVAGLPLPQNKPSSHSDIDLHFRHLDCAVFEYMHNEMKMQQEKVFDSVRGAFWEGKELYPSAGFAEKNHIQICVRNANCIKGYFKPLEVDERYPRV